MLKMPKMIGNGYQPEKFLQGLLIANSKEIMTHWPDKYIPAPKCELVQICLTLTILS